MCQGIDIGIFWEELHQYLEWDEDCYNCGYGPVIVYSPLGHYQTPGIPYDGDTVICPKCGEKGYLVHSPNGGYVQWFRELEEDVLSGGENE